MCHTKISDIFVCLGGVYVWCYVVCICTRPENKKIIAICDDTTYNNSAAVILCAVKNPEAASCFGAATSSRLDCIAVCFWRASKDILKMIIRVGAVMKMHLWQRSSAAIGATVPLRSKSTSSSASSRSSSWIAWYSSKLDTHPLLTKSISSGLIAGGGDFLCQTAIERGGPYDWARTGRFTLLGTFVVAPFVHGWYSVLNRLIPGVGVAAVTKRIALDQFVFSPSFLSVSCVPYLFVSRFDQETDR